MSIVLFADTLPLDLIKLLPDGATSVAIITIVILFLKQQDKAADSLKQITDSFQQSIRDLDSRQREAIVEINKRATDDRIHYQAQIETLMDEHMEMSREITGKLESLKTEVVTKLRGTYDASPKIPPQ